MSALKTTPQPETSDVEVCVYHYGQLKVRHWCQADEAPRIAALWNDVLGMRCEISKAPAKPDYQSPRLSA